MTTIDKLEGKIRNSENSYYVRLMRSLEYKPENWIWNGTIIDLGGVLGSCACGHEIRYQFPLTNKITGRTVIVGCICVENYKLFDSHTIGQMKEKIKEVEKEIRRKKAEAKKLVQKEEIEKLISGRKPLLEKLYKINDLYNETNAFKPYELYIYQPVNPEKYTRLSSCVKALKKDIGIINTICKNCEKEVSELEIKLAEKNKKVEEENERLYGLNHIGNIGERIEVQVTLVSKWFNDNYNSWLYKFEDKDGNLLIKWGTLKDVDFEKGCKYSFSCKIKKHTEWNGIKSTTITRLKDVRIL